MANNLSNYNADSYSLSNLRSEYTDARDKSLDNVTITVGFDSPDTFQHQWTFNNVNSVEEYQEELERTKEAAWNRLKQGWTSGGGDESNFNSKMRNEISLRIKEFPEEIDDFKQAKDREDALKTAVDKAQKVYDKTSDRGRNISISNKANNNSSNIQDFMDFMDKVEQTVDFENEAETQWEEGRQKTTGNVEWFMEDGQKVRTQIYTNKVVHLIGGAGGQRIEQSKSRGKEWYEDNRIA